MAAPRCFFTHLTRHKQRPQAASPPCSRPITIKSIGRSVGRRGRRILCGGHAHACASSRRPNAHPSRRAMRFRAATTSPCHSARCVRAMGSAAPCGPPTTATGCRTCTRDVPRRCRSRRARRPAGRRCRRRRCLRRRHPSLPLRRCPRAPRPAWRALLAGCACAPWRLPAARGPSTRTRSHLATPCRLAICARATASARRSATSTTAFSTATCTDATAARRPPTHRRPARAAASRRWTRSRTPPRRSRCSPSLPFFSAAAGVAPPLESRRRRAHQPARYPRARARAGAGPAGRAPKPSWCAMRCERLR